MRRASWLLLVLAWPAFADVPPADVSGCSGKTENAACERDDKSAGVCTKSTCSRNDYSQGIPPKSMSYECVKCLPAAAAPTPAPAEAPKSSSCASVEGGALLALAALLSRRKR